MRKIHLIALALFAVFAFSSIAASSAFAEQALFLVEKGEAKAEVPVESTGEVLLEDMTFKVAVLCVADDTGDIGPGALDKTLTVTFLTCTDETGCSKVGKVEAVHLPWKTELGELVEPFLDNVLKEAGITGEPGYSVECEGVKDECTGKTMAFIDNLLTEKPTDFDALFTAESEAGKCTLGGTGAGLVETQGEGTLISSTEKLNIEVS